MAVKTETSTFVYGRFVWPARIKENVPRAPFSEDIAIKVLREYSSAEFLGKLYARAQVFGGPPFGVGDWSPIAPAKVPSYDWYKWFSDKQQYLYFALEGSGIWEVVNFRNESDDSGPYVAIALKYPRPGSLPKWASTNLP